MLLHGAFQQATHSSFAPSLAVGDPHRAARRVAPTHGPVRSFFGSRSRFRRAKTLPHAVGATPRSPNSSTLRYAQRRMSRRIISSISGFSRMSMPAVYSCARRHGCPMPRSNRAIFIVELPTTLGCFVFVMVAAVSCKDTVRLPTSFVNFPANRLGPDFSASPSLLQSILPPRFTRIHSKGLPENLSYLQSTLTKTGGTPVRYDWPTACPPNCPAER